MKHRENTRLPLREHGGVTPELLASLGAAAENLLDLSVGANPYGPPPRVLDALSEARVASYPHPTAAPARAAIAARLQTSPERIVIGAGASELIWSCMRVLAKPDDTVLVVEPTYSELAAAARQQGARVLQWRAVERSGHRIELDQIGELMLLERPSLVCLCAPNTPTGASVPFTALQTLAARFAGVRFIVDQSWLALSEDHADYDSLPHDDVVCIRSLGKELGVVGARVGYAITSAALAARIEACRPAFSTSSATQAIAEASAHERTFIDASRERMLEDRDRLAYVLHKLELTCTPSVTPFVLIRMTHAAEVSHDLLQRHQILVRECASFGLPDHLRIAGLPTSHERRFEHALREVIERRRLPHGREA